MLTKKQEKLIRSLHSKKGRYKNNVCLVEGKKVIDVAKKWVVVSFTEKDTKYFDKLVTTETPQNQAAVVEIPDFSLKDVMEKDMIVVLDGVQDPGNVGTIMRLCLGYNAGLILVESADVTSPKVIRSSVGGMFRIPWIVVKRTDASRVIKKIGYKVLRLEKRVGARSLGSTALKKDIVLIAGSEGRGIKLKTKGMSIFVEHNDDLESLNVGHALAIAMHHIRL